MIACGGPASNPYVPQTSPGSPAANEVIIKSFSYNPKEINIKVGDTVTWTNEDSAAHTVTGSGWDSGNMGQGQTYSKTFDKAGTYEYYCTFHPSMLGSVAVK